MSEIGWHGRTALVTGGTGFIGCALVRRLAELGAQVIVPTRSRPLIGAAGSGAIRHVRSPGDDAGAMARLLAGADVLFNLAYDFRRGARANVALNAAAADACHIARVPMLVQASSIAVYDGWPDEDISEQSSCDGPGHDYKLAKRTVEKDIEARVTAGQFDAAILQPTIVYGPRSPQWVDTLVEHMKGGTLVLPTSGSGLCNGVYIDDVVEAFLAAAMLDRGGAERFIVSGPAPFPWADLFTAYAEACGATVAYEETTPLQTQPATPAPMGTAQALVSRLVREGSAVAAGLIGSTRLEQLRVRLMALKPGTRIYRPFVENPQLFNANATADTAKASARLRASTIDGTEGLKRTQAYIRTKYH